MDEKCFSDIMSFHQYFNMGKKCIIMITDMSIVILYKTFSAQYVPLKL